MGLGFRVYGLRVYGLRVQGLWLNPRPKPLGLRILGWRYGVEGLQFGD